MVGLNPVGPLQAAVLQFVGCPVSKLAQLLVVNQQTGIEMRRVTVPQRRVALIVETAIGQAVGAQIAPDVMVAPLQQGEDPHQWRPTIITWHHLRQVGAAGIAVPTPEEHGSQLRFLSHQLLDSQLEDAIVAPQLHSIALTTGNDELLHFLEGIE